MAPVPPITFRPPAEMRLLLEQLRAASPKQQWAEVFNMVFTDDVIRARVRELVSTA